MKVKASLLIKDLSVSEAATMAEALKPDNVGIPKGCEISLLIKKDWLLCEVNGEMDTGSFLSILKDLMINLKVTKTVLDVIK